MESYYVTQYRDGSPCHTTGTYGRRDEAVARAQTLARQYPGQPVEVYRTYETRVGGEATGTAHQFVHTEVA